MALEEIHPLVIHFPIALLSTSVLLDAVAVLWRQERFQWAGLFNLILGMVSALVAVVTGFLADTLEGHMEDPFPIYTTHGSMQLVIVALFAGMLVWRWRTGGRLPSERRQQWLYLAWGLIAVASLFYGAHLGAKLAGRI
jgi:uncharacterized membrane protein